MSYLQVISGQFYKKKKQNEMLLIKGELYMRKGYWKQLSYEDKFDRKYACWTLNHRGWRKCKRRNRRMARRKLKRMEMVF